MSSSLPAFSFFPLDDERPSSRAAGPVPIADILQRRARHGSDDVIRVGRHRFPCTATLNIESRAGCLQQLVPRRLVVTGLAAAWVWGARAVAPDVIACTRPLGMRSRWPLCDDAIVESEQSRPLPQQIFHINGLRVISPASLYLRLRAVSDPVVSTPMLNRLQSLGHHPALTRYTS